MLGSSKAIQESDILVKIIKGNSDLLAEAIFNFLKESFKKVSFLIAWKWQMLPQSSKRLHVPQKIIINQLVVNYLLVNKQLSEFFESILSKFHCVFRKEYGAQHFLNVLETWKEPTDNNKAFGALLMGILKSFDY